MDLYYVGNTGNWNTAANWSASSGGAGGAGVPTVNDNVILDENSFSAFGQTLTVDVAAVCKDFTATAVTNKPTIHLSSTYDIDFYGTVTVGGGLVSFTVNVGGFNYLRFYGDAQKVDMNDNYYSGGVAFDGSSTKLLSDFRIGYGFSIDTGSVLYLNGNKLKNNGALLGGTDTFLGTLDADRGIYEHTNGSNDIDFATGDWDNLSTATLQLAAAGQYTFTDGEEIKKIEISGSGGSPAGGIFGQARLTNASIDCSGTVQLEDILVKEVLTITGGGKVTMTDGIAIHTLTVDDSGVEIVTHGDADFHNLNLGASTQWSAWGALVEVYGDITALGTSGNLITITTSDADLESDNRRLTIKKRTGVVESDYLNFDKVDLVGDSAWYVGDNSTLDGCTGFIQGDKPTIDTETIFCRVYAPNGSFLGTWESDIAGTDTLVAETGLASADMVIHLQKSLLSYNANDEFNHFNKVKVFRRDRNNPNGELEFNGEIVRIARDYKEDSISVTLRSLSDDLNHTILESASDLFINNATEGGTYGGLNQIEEYITTYEIDPPAGYDNIASVGIFTYFSSYSTSYDYSGKYIMMSIHSNLADAKAGDAPLASGRIALNELLEEPLNRQFHYWNLSTPLSIDDTGATDYYLRVYVNDSTIPGHVVWRDSSDSYTGDLNYHNGISWVASGATAMRIKVGSADGETTVSITGVIDENIKDIIDIYSDKGGVVEYSPFSIAEVSDDSVSYGYKVATALEGLQKQEELAGNEFAGYVDPATLIYHLINITEENGLTEHTLNFHKAVENFELITDSSDVTSDLYFSGGDTGSGYLYKRYVNEIEDAGTRERKLQDGRVTVEATADKLAAANLNTNSYPRISARVEIGNNEVTAEGYNVRSIKLGDIINFTGLASDHRNLYDIATFDENDHYDYNLDDITTIPFVVRHISRKRDNTALVLHDLPPRMQGIVSEVKRGVTDLETINNPDAPS